MSDLKYDHPRAYHCRSISLRVDQGVHKTKCLDE